MHRQDIAEQWVPSRVSDIRRVMRAHDLYGYIIPRWDAYQSEYVVPRDERLAWLTGFTGTWGLALVTQDALILFVDGRYTVQANNEVEPEYIEVRHLYDDPLESWLTKNAKPGQDYGFDPAILNWVTHRSALSAANANGAKLTSVHPNLVDEVWESRPKEVLRPANPYPLARSGETSLSKRKRLATTMSARQLDVIVETQIDNIAWLLNIRGSDVPENPMVQSSMIFDASGAIELFIDSRKLTPGAPYEFDYVNIYHPDQLLNRLKKRIRPHQKVGVDPRFGPVGAVLAVEEAGANATIACSPLTELKSIKSQTELAGIASACHRDSIAWIKLLTWLDAEVAQRDTSGIALSELDVEERLLEIRRTLPDFQENSFRTIAASGPNAAMCHYNAPAGGGRSLNTQEMFLLDAGGQFLDGTTDTTRTMCFGEPLPAWRKAYTSVLKGHIALSSQIFPVGTRGYQLDALARSFLWQQRMDYDHGTGHGVGHFLSVHEQPNRIGKEPLDVPLCAGMTITIEPGYYEPEEFGIRIENLYHIVEDRTGWLRFECLMHLPLCRALIDVARLTPQEIAWLDSYHSLTRQKASDSSFSAEERAWIERATEMLYSPALPAAP